jgi:choline monooxygenase
VREAGHYFTGELLGEPYVVVRDQQGQLRAFFNVCRHHASKVATVPASLPPLPHHCVRYLNFQAQGEGCKNELVCPYHGWTYQLDGRLRVAPRVGGIKGTINTALQNIFNINRLLINDILAERSWSPALSWAACNY